MDIEEQKTTEQFVKRPQATRTTIREERPRTENDRTIREVQQMCLQVPQ